MPVTRWFLDGIPKVDLDSWQLVVRWPGGGQMWSYADLLDAADDEVQAIIDCTGGWWSEQVWRGCSLAAVLAEVQPLEGAREAAVLSVTGHRMVLPLDELRSAVLATHVGGEPLSIPHGFPVRLAAPGRRGYYWVKWLRRIDVL
jgi:DMSO/TMAO reductase YedYZ molybdopterin-dependent catalytic subunit